MRKVIFSQSPDSRQLLGSGICCLQQDTAAQTLGKSKAHGQHQPTLGAESFYPKLRQLQQLHHTQELDTTTTDMEWL